MLVEFDLYWVELGLVEFQLFWVELGLVAESEITSPYWLDICPVKGKFDWTFY